MKKLLIIPVLLMLAACGPVELPIYDEVQPNESAYVIPLEGATKTNQGKFDSVSFLEEKKVAAKRSDREAKEGVVIAKTTADNKSGIVLCISAETDFVSNNAEFVTFVKTQDGPKKTSSSQVTPV